MTLPGYKHQPSEKWVDPTPLPDDLPKVEEIGATSAPLKSIAFFFNSLCQEYNEDFMLCKAENPDPKHCLTEGRKVTRCSIDVLSKVKENCAEVFESHWKCLDLGNQEYQMCRPEEKKLNDCIFTKLGWTKVIPGTPKGQTQVNELKNPIFK
ncbi:NADH-ubiquinone oxidoreductase [Smittium culicis]|uniref:NADH-ubiquinone oxidoreductase n=1 Tax=Smittium culicis TaxID=133412 RepID=A0A1R1YS81_9FUNG|nr:NADH-ubiquinone oxidoreductase [Smittium culicis]